MTPGFNTPLIRKVIEHIQENPQQWYQEDWRCGSGMCVAGWAIELSGFGWAFKPTFAPGSDKVIVSEEQAQEMFGSRWEKETETVGDFITKQPRNGDNNREDFRRNLMRGVTGQHLIAPAHMVGEALVGQITVTRPCKEDPGDCHAGDEPHTHEVELFDADNHIEDVVSIATELAEEPII